MSVEPEKFFIGLMEFFSILLPGALLNYIVMSRLGPVLLGCDKFQKLTGGEGLAVFLVVSYLFGHLIFLLGSWLDNIYDWARRNTLNSQIIQLSRRGRLLPWAARAASWLLFKRERNLAVNAAKKIKNGQLASVAPGEAINTFQWCKAWLTENKPKSMAVVQRFEADSKFFRCFVVVLLILTGMWIAEQKWPLVTIAVLLVPFATWRYMEQRWKSTNQAYWSVITAFAAEANPGEAEQAHSDNAAPVEIFLTHAGGVVFRERGNKVEYLLVEAKNEPKELVLPKGHIEKDEQPRDTAVREVHEETGVWARIHKNGDLGPIPFKEDEADITVQFFLMEYAGRGIRQDTDREHLWLPLSVAEDEAVFPETRTLLQSAEKQRLDTLYVTKTKSQ